MLLSQSINLSFCFWVCSGACDSTRNANASLSGHATKALAVNDRIADNIFSVVIYLLHNHLTNNIIIPSSSSSSTSSQPGCTALHCVLRPVRRFSALKPRSPKPLVCCRHSLSEPTIFFVVLKHNNSSSSYSLTANSAASSWLGHLDTFQRRHIGPSPAHQKEMLAAVGVSVCMIIFLGVRRCRYCIK